MNYQKKILNPVVETRGKKKVRSITGTPDRVQSDSGSKMTNDDDYFFDAVKNAAATRTYQTAVRLRLSDAEREDMQQDLIVDLLERSHRFDASKGSANTFTGMVSEHKAYELMNKLIKDRQRLSFDKNAIAANDAEFNLSTDGDYDYVSPMWTDDRDLFCDSEALHDVRAALACMSQSQLDLFNLIDCHHDLPSAAAASGMATATFYRRIEDLRMHLRMFGIRPAA